ncbi:MAG: enoyl-CoA hydratase/isomerase family protein [Candidatus Thorarchaeota archaeon]|jgi:enoyl-CoA hydratase
MSGEIKVDKKDPVAVVTIFRPEKLNSVTHEMLISFDETVARLTNDKDIAVIIFTGEGEKAFSAGFDLDTVKGLEGETKTEFFKLLESSMRTIREARNCITIAAVNGYAVGFGAMTASACDLRFFSDTAVFRLPEMALDIFPGGGAASNLLHLVGPSRAKDILLTSRTVSAEEALKIGLADRIFPLDTLMKETLSYVDELVKMNRTVLLRTKTLVDGMTGKDVADAAEQENAYFEEWLRECEE